MKKYRIVVSEFNQPVSSDVVEEEIYQQQVDFLDLQAVIRAVNGPSGEISNADIGQTFGCTCGSTAICKRHNG